MVLYDGHLWIHDDSTHYDSSKQEDISAEVLDSLDFPEGHGSSKQKNTGAAYNTAESSHQQ
eukprot:6629200-Heterocapsa_arctica.AAC.1